MHFLISTFKSTLQLLPWGIYSDIVVMQRNHLFFKPHGSNYHPKHVPKKLWIWKKKKDMFLHLCEIQHPTAVSTIHQNSGLCLQKREVFAVTILVFHSSCCWGTHVRKSRHSRDLFWTPRGAKNRRRAWQTQRWGHLISKRAGETHAGVDWPAKIHDSWISGPLLRLCCWHWGCPHTFLCNYSWLKLTGSGGRAMVEWEGKQLFSGQVYLILTCEFVEVSL